MVRRRQLQRGRRRCAIGVLEVERGGVEGVWWLLQYEVEVDLPCCSLCDTEPLRLTVGRQVCLRLVCHKSSHASVVESKDQMKL